MGEVFLVSDPATWPVTLSVAEVCLVANVSAPTLRRMVKRGSFPPPISMPGVRKKLWSKAVILEWLQWPVTNNSTEPST